MRIFSNCLELMSELGRELNSYGQIVKPKYYQNKYIGDDSNFITKELNCQTYCLTSLELYGCLFIYNPKNLDWANSEFNERISGDRLNPGEAWKLNSDMWEQFLVNGKFDYTYSERIGRGNTSNNNLDFIIELLKSDPGTRKAVLSIYDPSIDMYHYSGDARIPCSMYYDFLIRDHGKGPQLNISYHQRSSDFVQHFGDDVYLAFRLMQYIAEKIGIKPGYLFHTIDSLHVYQKDWITLSQNIEDLNK